MNRFLHKIKDLLLLTYEINGFSPNIHQIKGLVLDEINKNKIIYNKIPKRQYGLIFFENPDMNWKLQLSMEQRKRLRPVKLDIELFDKNKFIKTFNTDDYKMFVKQNKMSKITPNSFPPVFFKYL